MGRPKTELGKGKGAHLTLYLMQGNLQEDAFKDKRLWMATENEQQHAYYTINYGKLGADGNPATATQKEGKKIADGWYDFVAPCDNPLVVVLRHSLLQWRSPRGKTWKNRGHSSVAGEGAPVYFAGEILFKPQGVLKKWTNKTGHYYVGAQFDYSLPKLKEHVEQQTGLVLDMHGNRLLPMAAFEPWDGDL
jgi:hypothetical protein